MASLAQLDRTIPPCPAAAAFGGSDRLIHEIFSFLESKFLFGAPLQPDAAAGRVHVLSIDGGALAAAALVRLERRLQDLSGDPAARVADFFDLAAGSGAGGFLAAAFACRMPAEAARDVVTKNRKTLMSGRRGGGVGLFRWPAAAAVFRKVFGELTVRDAAKPLLIPCYEPTTRGDGRAVRLLLRRRGGGREAFDFPLWQVCAAACVAEAALSERGVESVLFDGKKLKAQTNGE